MSGLDFLRGGTRPPQSLIVAFIDELRAEGHAVESICRVLCEQGCQIAARTYREWAQANAPVAARTQSAAIVVDQVRDLVWKVDHAGNIAWIGRPSNENPCGRSVPFFTGHYPMAGRRG